MTATANPAARRLTTQPPGGSPPSRQAADKGSVEGFGEGSLSPEITTPRPLPEETRAHEHTPAHAREELHPEAAVRAVERAEREKLTLDERRELDLRRLAEQFPEDFEEGPRETTARPSRPTIITLATGTDGA